MPPLKVGAYIRATADAVIDSVLPTTYTASHILLPGVDQIAQGDPTTASLNLTLPDATTNAGVEFFIKNIGLSATNTMTLLPAGSDSIDRVTTGAILAQSSEWIRVYSDGTTIWRRSGLRTFTFATLQATGGNDFSVTTAFTKFDEWTSSPFSTPDKFVGSVANNELDIIDFQGPTIDGYKTSASISFEYNAPKIVTIQMSAGGVLFGVPQSVKADGAGKPASISVEIPVTVNSASSIELHIKAEENGTLSNINAFMLGERIGG